MWNHDVLGRAIYFGCGAIIIGLVACLTILWNVLPDGTSLDLQGRVVDLQGSTQKMMDSYQEMYNQMLYWQIKARIANLEAGGEDPNSIDELKGVLSAVETIGEEKHNFQKLIFSVEGNP